MEQHISQSELKIKTTLCRCLETKRIDVQQEVGNSSWFSFGCVLSGSLTGNRDRVVEQFYKHGVEARPLAVETFLAQPVISQLKYKALGNYEAHAENIHNNGFWVGNHAIDCKHGIDCIIKHLRTLL